MEGDTSVLQYIYIKHGYLLVPKVSRILHLLRSEAPTPQPLYLAFYDKDVIFINNYTIQLEL